MSSSAADIKLEQKQGYWLYQYRLGKEYLVPLLQAWDIVLAEKTVLDIGCAEAGVLCAVAEQGARCNGIELSPSRLSFARKFIPPAVASQLHLTAANIYRLPLKPARFDLILLRDVFEHLPDQERALQIIAHLTDANSRILITFPPFYSPFGGHQQMLKSFLRRVPYFHALPNFIWRWLSRWIDKNDANAGFLAEMEKLRQSRVTIGGFRRLAKKAGLKIRKGKFYLSRPSYRLRYGWPVISGDWMSKIPLLREGFLTGAFFLLGKNEADKP